MRREILQIEFAREMWAQYEQGELTADSKLKGVCARDERAADADGVLLVAVEDAREEALRRELGRESQLRNLDL